MIFFDKMIVNNAILNFEKKKNRLDQNIITSILIHDPNIEHSLVRDQTRYILAFFNQKEENTDGLERLERKGMKEITRLFSMKMI